MGEDCAEREKGEKEKRRKEKRRKGERRREKGEGRSFFWVEVLKLVFLVFIKLEIIADNCFNLGNSIAKSSFVIIFSSFAK